MEITLSKILEECYKLYKEEQTLELNEAFHKDNPLLNKNIKGNEIRRTRLALALRYLRRARDKFREFKPWKANLIDNISRSLTRANSADPTLRKIVNTPLNKFSKEERNNLFNYMPKFTTVPWEKLDIFKNRINYEKTSELPIKRKLSDIFDEKEITNLQKSLKIMNDRRILDDKMYELFKFAPRIASSIREPNSLLNYNQSKRMIKFYNLKPEEVIRSSGNIFQNTKQ